MEGSVSFFTRSKAGVAFGQIGDKISIDNPDPTITIEGPAIYSHDGQFLAVVKNHGMGFSIYNTSDRSIYFDVWGSCALY